MLLAYLLLYPDVAADFLEDLAEWKTPIPRFDEILENLVEALAADPDITAERLKEHLHTTAQAGIYDLLSAELEMLNRKNPLPQEAREGIVLLLSGMRKKALRSELQALAEKIAAAGEDEAGQLWEKYQNLLKEEKDLA